MNHPAIATVAPRQLAAARTVAHKAVQLPSLAARANLAAAADDSHANLAWNRAAGWFESQPISNQSGVWHITAALAPLALGVALDGVQTVSLALAGTTFADAAAWLDRQLVDAGLAATGDVTLPYALPPEVADLDRFDVADAAPALAALAAWYDLAEATLTGFVAGRTGLTPGPSPVRCWPHHFDIATYVALTAGDAESAPGIGVGMSPGDDAYDQPYFYINPWPPRDAATLPPLPLPANWHTQGFVGAIVTAEAVLSLADPDGIASLADAAFDIGRDLLKA